MGKRIARIALNVLALLLLLGTLVFLILHWREIPDRVPAHYDGAGRIDGFGGKSSLLMLPALNAVLYVTFLFARTMRFRSLGREVRVPAPQLMFPALSLILTAGLSYMTVCTALVRPLGAWFLPVFLTATLAPLIAFSIYTFAKLR